jgi:hypothetical protein
MNLQANLTRHRIVVWVAALAVLVAALTPTANALRVKWLGEPLAFAELCTKFGMVKVALERSGTAPTPAPVHGAPECAACLPSATWLAVLAPLPFDVSALAAVHERPRESAAAPRSWPAHTIARSRAPPSFS